MLASEGPPAQERLFRVVRALRDRGTSILLITQRLEEIEQMSDDITVLRDGRHVATQPAATLDRAALVPLMVGRPLETLFTRRAAPPPGDEVLNGREARAARQLRRRLLLRARRRDRRYGGLVGAGRTEIAETLFGITPPTAGHIWLRGAEVHPKSPRQMLGLGLAYLPEDRDREGLIMAESVVHNITLPILQRLLRGIRSSSATSRRTRRT